MLSSAISDWWFGMTGRSGDHGTPGSSAVAALALESAANSCCSSTSEDRYYLIFRGIITLSDNMKIPQKLWVSGVSLRQANGREKRIWLHATSSTHARALQTHPTRELSAQLPTYIHAWACFVSDLLPGKHHHPRPHLCPAYSSNHCFPNPPSPRLHPPLWLRSGHLRSTGGAFSYAQHGLSRTSSCACVHSVGAEAVPIFWNTTGRVAVAELPCVSWSPDPPDMPRPSSEITLEIYLCTVTSRYFNSKYISQSYICAAKIYICAVKSSIFAAKSSICAAKVLYVRRKVICAASKVICAVRKVICAQWSI